MKYKLTEKCKYVQGVKLYRIEALKDFGDVKKGDLGGWAESEKNLSQHGNAWVSDNALVFDNALVSGDARVSGNARVYGNAWVSDNALVFKTNDYMCFQSFGSQGRTTTVIKTKDGHIIKCGCWSGTLDRFINQIKETHGDNQHAREYLAICEVIKIRIESWEDK